MGAPRMMSVRGKLHKTLSDGLRAFAVVHPECLEPEYESLYLIALTTAECVDRSPSAALIREFHVTNSKLRKAILGESDPKEPSLADIIAAAGE